jgi:D-sedoheptulose 7-phosphate isomerase
MLELIRASLKEHLDCIQHMGALTEILRQSGEQLIQTIQSGGCTFICGNGGSAGDAQHFAAELTGRFERERRGWPALALTTDTSALTAIGNDYGFDFVFSRQMEALARPGDLLIAISTSGNSRNVLQAVAHAKANRIATIGLLGRDGGQLAREVDHALVVPSQRTARIQEMHILILHIWCEMLDAAGQ